MGRAGSALDNAISESFASTLKCELVHRRRFPSREAARTAILEYLEGFYNRSRLHSALGYRSPADYEEARAEEVAMVQRECVHLTVVIPACVYLMNEYSGSEPINVGVGEDISIKELAELVREVVGYAGEVVYDTTKPDGTPRKLLDVSKLHDLGWRAKVPLSEGIERTYAWFLGLRSVEAGR